MSGAPRPPTNAKVTAPPVAPVHAVISSPCAMSFVKTRTGRFGHRVVSPPLAEALCSRNGALASPERRTRRRPARREREQQGHEPPEPPPGWVGGHDGSDPVDGTPAISRAAASIVVWSSPSTITRARDSVPE